MRRRTRRRSSFWCTALTCASGVLLKRQAQNAGKSGDWANCLEVLLGSGKLSVWTSAKGKKMRTDSALYWIFCGKAPTSTKADHRASRRSGRGHLVVRMPSLPPIPAGRLHFGRNNARLVWRVFGLSVLSRGFLCRLGEASRT